MLKLRLFSVGDIARGAFAEIRDHYVKSLSSYVKFEHVVVKDVEAFAKHLMSDAFTIVLDEHGKTMSSDVFAKQIGALKDSGRHVDVFLGGAFGIPQALKDSADLRLSLSPMTTTHDLAHLFFLEQLYRARTIHTGKKYHY